MTEYQEPKYEDIKEGVIEDARNGELIPKGSPPVIATTNTMQLQVKAETIGTLELSPETEKILDEPLDPKDVRIRPDGLVYLPWTWYAAKLNRAFGRLKWGLIPQGSPQSKDAGNNTVLVIWGNWLMIKGIPVGFAVGETSYKTNNYTMSYADAIEGAKSISLARNCKMLGIALDLWNPEWIEEWKKEFAETYKNDKDKIVWRKKGSKKPEQSEQKKSEETVLTGDPDKDFPKVETPSDGRFTKKQIRGSADHITAIIKKSGKDAPTVLKLVGSLDEKTKYSISEIVDMLTTTDLKGKEDE